MTISKWPSAAALCSAVCPVCKREIGKQNQQNFQQPTHQKTLTEKICENLTGQFFDSRRNPEKECTRKLHKKMVICLGFLPKVEIFARNVPLEMPFLFVFVN